MTIALMQPYFFPYLGQFQIINAVERFILVDELQYIQNGWMHRNRILKPTGGWQYVILPVGKQQIHLSTLIQDIKIVPGNEWKERILGQIGHYKKTAPYYRHVHEFLKDCFDSVDERYITNLNGCYLKRVCDYIGINHQIEISSQFNLDYSTVTDKEDRGIKMCQQLGASVLINPPGGVNLYDKNSFADTTSRYLF